MSNTRRQPQNQQPQNQQGSLGLPTTSLQGVSVEEIVGNKTAIMMLLHRQREMEDENVTLKNDRNTLGTYITGYEKKTSRSKTGALVLALSNVLNGFGVNYLTGGQFWLGFGLFLPGLACIIVGLYLSLTEG